MFWVSALSSFSLGFPMGEPLRRLCVYLLEGMTLKCNTQRTLFLFMIFRSSSEGGGFFGGGWYHSIPITLVGTTLHLPFFRYVRDYVLSASTLFE